MITGRDILYISSIEWSFLWQTHQEIALRLGAAGNRVLYIENTGVRSPRIRDAGRVARRLKHWAGAAGSQGLREVAPNINVCSPLVMPPFGAKWRQMVNRRVFVPALLRAVLQLGMRDIIVWTYLPNDTMLSLIDALRSEISALVYYCVADFEQLSPHVEQLQRAERALVKQSDLLLTNCSALAQKFSPINPHTHVFPGGVNLEAFPLELKSHQPGSNGHGTMLDARSADYVATLARPIIGYVGGMHRHVDYALIREMAQHRPDWSWVYVGVAQTAMEQLSNMPNIHLIGQRPHEELVNYIRQFDVCTVPYLNSEYTATVVPTKINEYLAMMKPIVSTALPTICAFNEQHRVLITANSSTDKFLEAIEHALVLPRNEATLRHRRRVAELHDWSKRFGDMCDLVQERLQS